MIQLTREEKAAIAELKKLAQKWPDTLWLFSASGSLHVMRYDDDGNSVHKDNFGFDPEYVVASIYGIDNDGGEW